jgi:hypothetical protein
VIWEEATTKRFIVVNGLKVMNADVEDINMRIIFFFIVTHRWVDVEVNDTTLSVTVYGVVLYKASQTLPPLLIYYAPHLSSNHS